MKASVFDDGEASGAIEADGRRSKRRPKRRAWLQFDRLVMVGADETKSLKSLSLIQEYSIVFTLFRLWHSQTRRPGASAALPSVWRIIKSSDE